MKFLTLFMFAAVLISAVIAADKVEKKKSIWWHAPMFKKTWNQAKICHREFRLANCWDDLKDQFGKGVIVFVDRYLTKKEEPPQ